MTLAEAALRELLDGPSATAQRQAESANLKVHVQLDQLAAPPDPVTIKLQEIAVGDARRKLQTAEEDLAGASLLAPFDALIVQTSAVPGVNVSGSVMQLAEAGSILLRSNIDESDIGRVQVGQAAGVTFKSLGGVTYQGKVMARGVTGISSQGLVTYPVDIKLDAPDSKLLGGLSGDLTITVKESPQALVVPREAVQTVRGRSVVRVVQPDGTLAPRPVEVGISDGLNVEIVSGVNEGDRVAVQASASGANSSGGHIRIPGGGGFGGGLR